MKGKNIIEIQILDFFFRHSVALIKWKLHMPQAQLLKGDMCAQLQLGGSWNWSTVCVFGCKVYLTSLDLV